MTKKDYTTVANIMFESFAEAESNPDAISLMNRVLNRFCNLFEKDIPNFNRDRFCEAAGLLRKSSFPDIDMHDRELGYDNALGQTRN